MFYFLGPGNLFNLHVMTFLIYLIIFYIMVLLWNSHGVWEDNMDFFFYYFFIF